MQTHNGAVKQLLLKHGADPQQANCESDGEDAQITVQTAEPDAHQQLRLVRAVFVRVCRFWCHVRVFCVCVCVQMRTAFDSARLVPSNSKKHNPEAQHKDPWFDRHRNNTQHKAQMHKLGMANTFALVFVACCFIWAACWCAVFMRRAQRTNSAVNETVERRDCRCWPECMYNMSVCERP